MLLTTSLITSFIAVSSPYIINSESSFIIKEERVNNYYKDKYKDLKSEVDTYQNFQKNWDGYDAEILTAEVIDNSKRFLSLLEDFDVLKPNVFPRTYGEIGIYWRKKDNYLEVNINDKDTISYFYEINGEIFGEEDLPLTKIPSRMKDAIDRLKTANSTSDSRFVFNIPTTNWVTL